MKLKLEAYVHDEYYDEIPDFAYVEINEAFVDRVILLKKVMEEYDLDKVSNYDDSPVFMVSETDENYDETGVEKEHEDFRYDLMMMNVHKHSGVNWTFFIKNTNINGTVDGPEMSSIETMKEVYAMSKEDLPTLINHKDPYIQALVKERLNESETA